MEDLRYTDRSRPPVRNAARPGGSFFSATRSLSLAVLILRQPSVALTLRLANSPVRCIRIITASDSERVVVRADGAARQAVDPDGDLWWGYRPDGYGTDDDPLAVARGTDLAVDRPTRRGLSGLPRTVRLAADRPTCRGPSELCAANPDATPFRRGLGSIEVDALPILDILDDSLQLFRIPDVSGAATSRPGTCAKCPTSAKPHPACRGRLERDEDRPDGGLGCDDHMHVICPYIDGPQRPPSSLAGLHDRVASGSTMRCRERERHTWQCRALVDLPARVRRNPRLSIDVASSVGRSACVTVEPRAVRAKRHKVRKRSWQVVEFHAPRIESGGQQLCDQVAPRCSEANPVRTTTRSLSLAVLMARLTIRLAADRPCATTPVGITGIRGTSDSPPRDQYRERQRAGRRPDCTLPWKNPY